MEKLLAYLNGIAPLSTELREHLQDILKWKEAGKDEILLEPGKVCQHISFLETGAVKIYRVLHEKESISWILAEGDVFISVKSFFEQCPSEDWIKTLEPCRIWYIYFRELDDTINKHPAFFEHYNRIKTKYYAFSEAKVCELLHSSPIEKMEWFMKTHPDWLGRFDSKDLMAYLNISPESYFKAKSALLGRPYVKSKK